MRYYDKMQRYSGLGAGFLERIFAPGLVWAEETAEAIKKAEAEKRAAESEIARQGVTAELEKRLAAAQAEIARLKALPPQKAGVNWLALGAIGLGAYFLFFRKQRRTTRRNPYDPMTGARITRAGMKRMSKLQLWDLLTPRERQLLLDLNGTIRRTPKSQMISWIVRR